MKNVFYVIFQILISIKIIKCVIIVSTIIIIEHNQNVIEDFENGKITKEEKKSTPCMNCDSINVTLIDEQYICLSCGCSNGYKFIDNKVEYMYYKKFFYNRKYQLEKYIRKYESYENFDRMQVILLFYKIIN